MILFDGIGGHSNYSSLTRLSFLLGVGTLAKDSIIRKLQLRLTIIINHLVKEDEGGIPPFISFTDFQGFNVSLTNAESTRVSEEDELSLNKRGGPKIESDISPSI